MHSFRQSIQLDLCFLLEKYFGGSTARLADLSSRPGIEPELSALYFHFSEMIHGLWPLSSALKEFLAETVVFSHLSVILQMIY